MNKETPRSDTAWCPGCGNFAILETMERVIREIGLDPSSLVFVSGIGQAAKLPQYLEVNYFNGLHGRALPAAVGIKLANPGLTVIAESGDGCTYGEGGNHFVHTIRRNTDLTLVVHNNMVYGLTKGQASPTSPRGFRNPLQPDGVEMEPFNPLSTAIALNVSFAARVFSGDRDMSAEIIKKAVLHRGISLVDILQPCVTFNRINTYRWFREHTFYLGENYDPHDREKAFMASIENEKLPLGIIYMRKQDAIA
jgi:2-oxoglutarate ferredoxin oxidoreductase subunit beta